MEERANHRSGVGALIIIAVGTLLLFNNLGILSWDIWAVLWRFWPVILIIWGLDLVLSHSWLGNLLITLLVGVFLAGLITIAVAENNPGFNSWLQQNIPFLYRLEQNFPQTRSPYTINHLRLRQGQPYYW